RPGAPPNAAARGPAAAGAKGGAAAATGAAAAAGSALSAVDEAHERWLIQKDKLDFGPFKIGDVKSQIESGQIRGDHTIVDMENDSDPSFTFNVSMKVDPPVARKKGHHRPGGKGGADEFDSATNLGDANSEGGDETLPEDVVQKVMMSNFKVLGGCLREEKAR